MRFRFTPLAAAFGARAQDLESPLFVSWCPHWLHVPKLRLPFSIKPRTPRGFRTIVGWPVIEVAANRAEMRTCKSLR